MKEKWDVLEEEIAEALVKLEAAAGPPLFMSLQEAAVETARLPFVELVAADDACRMYCARLEWPQVSAAVAQQLFSRLLFAGHAIESLRNPVDSSAPSAGPEGGPSQCLLYFLVRHWWEQALKEPWWWDFGQFGALRALYHATQEE